MRSSALESSGKTIIALQVIAEAQRQAAGGRPSTPSSLWIPFTHASLEWISTVCEYRGRIMASKPCSSRALISSGAIDVVVVDSVVALVPKAELEGEMATASWSSTRG